MLKKKTSPGVQGDVQSSAQLVSCLCDERTLDLLGSHVYLHSTEQVKAFLLVIRYSQWTNRFCRRRFQCYCICIGFLLTIQHMDSQSLIVVHGTVIQFPRPEKYRKKDS